MAHQSELKVICFESPAFYRMIEIVYERLKEQNDVKEERWINEQEAMKLLHIKAKSTMQKYRNEGKIRYTQPTKKLVLYDRISIMDLLESYAKETI